MPELDHKSLRVMRPSHGLISLQLLRLWEYRELLFFLAWRDLKVRYKQTVLGVAWAILQPLATMLVFSIFFGRLAKIPSAGVPYPIFVYCALVPWQMFSFVLTESGNSLLHNQYMLTKIYFPRLVVPIAPVLTALVDFAVAFTMLVGMMVYYGVVPKATVLLLPFFLALALLTALAVGVWLAALTAEYRDVRHTIPFLTQFWMYVTPIVYPSSLVPEKWRILYGLNPMAGVVEGFRWALLGTPPTPLAALFPSLLLVLLLLFSGLIYFRRLESTFADVI
jgi:lipopolysaccharide transport system permease protein